MTMKESHVNIHNVPGVIICFLQDPEWGSSATPLRGNRLIGACVYLYFPD